MKVDTSQTSTKLEEPKAVLDATKAASDVAWDAYMMAYGYWADLSDIKPETDPNVQEAWLEVKKAEEVWSSLYKIWQAAREEYEAELER
jgi:hypothetical protein